MRARGKEDPHTRVKEPVKQIGVPVVSGDYCFLAQGDEEPAKVLVLRDHATRMTLAYVVSEKGVGGDPWLPDRVADDIDDVLGLGDIVMALRTDNEPAMQALQLKVQEARAMRHKGTMLQHSDMNKIMNMVLQKGRSRRSNFRSRP